MHFRGWRAILIVSAACHGGLAEGQTQAPKPPADADHGDIVVTAQRRSESLERTPVAVAVLGARQLAEAQIVSESDLRSATPGLTVRSARSSNELNYAIRGQSVDAFSDSRPGVLPYVNDVQVSGSGSSSAFYDLQSIQVLKGPQGTLFGRSATGGAVLFTTQKPGPDFGGYASASGGNYGAVKLEGALNVPIVGDRLLARVSGLYQRREGFQEDVLTGERIGGFDRYGVRTSITAKPLDGVDNELVVDTAQYHGGATQAVLYNFGRPYNPADPGNAIPGAPLAVATYYGPGGIALQPGQQDIVSQLVAQKARGPFQVAFDGPNFYRTSNTLVTNTTTFDLGPNTQLKNIFGAWWLNSHYGTDVDGTTLTIDTAQLGINKNRQISEELHLLGKLLDNTLTYVVGGYFAHERVNSQQNSLVVPALGLLPQTNHYVQTTSTLAAYGQATYDLKSLTGVNGLGVTAGFRYTHEKATNQILPDDISYTTANLANPNVAFYQQKYPSNLSWTLGAQAQINPHILFYAVSRRSYKNAGFNGLNAPFIGLGSVDGGNGYATERLTDAELGFKASGRIGTMPAHLNLAVYGDWVKNAQHTAFAIGAGGAPAAITVNIPRAKITGLEADGEVSPLHWLSLGGTFNYTDARFTENDVNGILFGPYPDTPEFSGSIFIQTDFALHKGLDLIARGEVYAQSHNWITSTGIENTGGELPGYTLANFRIGIESNSRGWSLTANLKNAFNRVYYVGGLAPAELFQFNTTIPGDPRTFTVEARMKF